MNWRRQWPPTPVLLPGESHGWRSLVGCSPWGHEQSDTTERLHFHFSLSCIGEGNGNPLQCSCLENPRDRGAWWAAVYGVAQSRTRLKRLAAAAELWIPEFKRISRCKTKLCVRVHAKSLQLHPILCNPMDCSLPGSSVHGILQLSILEWVTIPFSRGSSQLRDQTQVSCIAGRFSTIWATTEAHIVANKRPK